MLDKSACFNLLYFRKGLFGFESKSKPSKTTPSLNFIQRLLFPKNKDHLNFFIENSNFCYPNVCLFKRVQISKKILSLYKNLNKEFSLL